MMSNKETSPRRRAAAAAANGGDLMEVRAASQSSRLWLT
jgi:hypothetical protein